MAGRGRGRGRSVSFNVEALGFGKGEALPGPILQPPPLFPPAEFKPVPLEQGDEYDYILALKQELEATMKKSPFYVCSTEKRKDISRYSDKYQFGNETTEKWTPDYSRLPAELKPRKIRKKNKSTVKPKIPVKRTKVDEKEIVKTLEELEKKEETSKDEVDAGDDEDEEKEKKDDGDEEEIEDEEFDEEEIEEETDYLLSYFDNGEEYANDDDDVDEGPVY